MATNNLRQYAHMLEGKWSSTVSARIGRLLLPASACLLLLVSVANGQTGQSPSQPISPEFPFVSRYVEVHGSKIHYVEEGSGDPILFLHGNPASSYLWRNVIPHLSPHGRAIAPDLIGYGKSDKPFIEYRVFDHIKYMEGFIEALGLTNITMVVHDWGSAVGLHIAMAHPEWVKAVAMMDAHIRPIPTWADFAEDKKSIEGFQAFRTPVVGWDLVITKNVFLADVFPGAMIRKITAEELDVYMAPFQSEESRQPVWRLANDIPVAGQPADTHALFAAYSQKLTQSEIPKLLIYFEPGFVIKRNELEWARANLPNLKTVQVGNSIHFVQEDDPHGIGEAIASWYQSLR